MDALNDGASVDHFFAVLRAELGIYERFKALHNPQLALDFNLVSCLCPDENRLSKVIADLLDPKGKHGQGAIFLKLFLEVVTNSSSESNHVTVERMKHLKEISNEALEKNRIKPQLEALTKCIENNQRRIDILLKINGFGIAVENKPWANDQKKQIQDYYDHLQQDFNDRFVLIYLSKDGTPPEHDSVSIEERFKMEQAGKFMVVGYSQIKEWCRLCAEKSCSARIRYFMEDFMIYIRDEFEGGRPMIEEQIIKDFAVKTPENIGAAIAIYYSWPAIAKSLIEELASSTFTSVFIPNENWVLGDVSFSFKNTQEGFCYYKKGWNNYCIKFAFFETNAIEFRFGIVSRDGEERPFLDNVRNKLDVKLGLGVKDAIWPWSQRFKEPFANWNENPDCWIGIRNGNTVAVVAEKLKSMIECIDDIDEYENL